ncbi:hypothetical protein DAEQUDRAFT_763840 [Daedalea quercina L-15889]|uniref:Thioredoxin-like fold domain-containing protein n=1 Tax=Daedalea quercina L-15889 TaxID=1314783 RepID=A0A165S7G9_9APHY|nr:hypothetical protein DAEQUDRAFT_763840 [Daedalea quercina L-15889]
MKLLPVLSASLALALSASAQYFSQGWQPGQSVAEEAQPTLVYRQAQQSVPTPESKPSRFDFKSVLTSGPVDFIASKMGVNMTEKLAQAEAAALAEAEMWDPRIPLITDASYEEIIVKEPLTPEEESERVWLLVITVSKGGKNAMSQKLDDSFDKAFNQTVIVGDLPNVRWGRIDYLNVTYITTKWSIWQAPYLAVLTDRGQTLRFYKTNVVRLEPEMIRDFLLQERWRDNKPWDSPFAPGGSWEPAIHYFSLALKRSYEFLILFPRWVLMLASGVIANIVMKVMHSSAGTDQPQPRPVAQTTPKDSNSAPTSDLNERTTNTKTSPAKSKGRRKTAKK